MLNRNIITEFERKKFTHHGVKSSKENLFHDSRHYRNEVCWIYLTTAAVVAGRGVEESDELFSHIEFFSSNARSSQRRPNFDASRIII